MLSRLITSEALAHRPFVSVVRDEKSPTPRSATSIAGVA
jgi:hypothetical protein